MWRFFDYKDDKNRIEDEWYSLLGEDAQDNFDYLLKHNSKNELQSWLGMKMLQGECKQEKIWEWRFFGDGRQQRLLGVFGKNRREVLFLIGCYHKQNVYTPEGCLKTAIKRAKILKEHPEYVIERQVKSDI